jgi:hypothetical protein
MGIVVAIEAVLSFVVGEMKPIEHSRTGEPVL